MKILKKQEYYYKGIKVLEAFLYDSKKTNEYILELGLDDARTKVLYNKETKKMEDIGIDYVATPLISCVLFGRHKVNLTYLEIKEQIIVREL